MPFADADRKTFYDRRLFRERRGNRQGVGIIVVRISWMIDDGLAARTRATFQQPQFPR